MIYQNKFLIFVYSSIWRRFRLFLFIYPFIDSLTRPSFSEFRKKIYFFLIKSMKCKNCQNWMPSFFESTPAKILTNFFNRLTGASVLKISSNPPFEFSLMIIILRITNFQVFKSLKKVRGGRVIRQIVTTLAAPCCR